MLKTSREGVVNKKTRMTCGYRVYEGELYPVEHANSGQVHVFSVPASCIILLFE